MTRQHGAHGSTWMLAFASLIAVTTATGCSKSTAPAPARNVTASPPPKDDGGAAKGAGSGAAHSAALEQLKVAPIAPKLDKQKSLAVPLPDAPHWTRVRFLTVKSLVGFRYGRDHHAVVGAFITHVPDNTVQGACNKSFEDWAAPLVEAFEVELKHEPPVAFAWSAPSAPAEPGGPAPVKRISIVDVDALSAKTATVLSRESYEAAWAAYPAWGNTACLVLGVAVPANEDHGRAREVRDRFVRDVFPKVAVTGHEEPKERY